MLIWQERRSLLAMLVGLDGDEVDLACDASSELNGV